MALFRPDERPVNITASGQRIIDPTSNDSKSKAPDASMLFDLYHRLGAIRAAMQMKYTAASKISYYPAIKPDPQSDPEVVESGPAVEAFDRIRGEHGTFGDFVAELAMQWDIVGEGYLVGLEKDGEENWDVWSSVEYEEWRRKNPRSDSNLIYRTWRSDPERGNKPDSPLRAVSPECEQYLLFRDVFTSVGKSRLISPLLYVPNEIDFPRDPDKPNQTFGEWLLEAQVKTVADTNSAGRVVGITIEGPGERADQVKVIDLMRELPEWIPDAMSKVLRQMAIGLDMPSDILAGVADVNHWSAWLIDDGLRLNYVDPMVLSVLGSLSRAYLQPALREAGVTDWQDYMFWRDYSDLTSRAVGASDAVALYDRGEISGDALRRTVGFTDADAPEVQPLEPAAATGELPVTSDTVEPGIPGEEAPRTRTPAFTMPIEELEDLVSAAGILIRSGFDPESTLEALGLPPIEHLGLLPVTVKDDKQAPGAGAEIEEAITASAAMPNRGRPPMSEIVRALTAAPSPSLAQIDHRLYAQVSEVAQAALDRALERAGARIRKEVQGAYRDGRAPKYQAQFQAIDGVDNHDVALTLGPGIKETFQLSDDELIPEGTFDRMGTRVEKILSQGQDDAYRSVVELTGAEPERDTGAERSWVTTAVAALTSGLVTFALRRLFTPTIDPDPADTGEIPQTEIPANLVFDSLTIAGGGVPSTDPTQPRGLANGAETERWVTSVGHQIEERVWSTGAPTRPFEPHQRLSGTRFTAWTDEVLKTPYSASWLSVDFMFPGDHRGCQCVAELVVDEATPAEEAA